MAQVGCRELKKLARSHPAHVLSAGGVPVLLKSIQDSLSSPGVATRVLVIRCACNALARMCADPQGRVEVATEGGPAIIVTAMQAVAQDAQIQAAACHALAMLPVPYLAAFVCRSPLHACHGPP